MERPLALHQSALSEPEYQAYTCILHEIAPDTAGVEWEAAQVPTGEAKGWIRGKYAVDAALLDQILRLFPATAFQGSLIKGPQLLAILRLISHAQAGLGVDRSLVFTQATKPLGSDIQATANVIPLGSPLPPPPSRSSPYPKPPPPVRQGSSSHTAPPDGATSGGRRVSSEDTASRTSLSSNPFRRSLSQNPGGIGGAGSAAYPRSHSAAGADDESSDGGRRSPTYSAPAITRASRPPSVTRSSSRKAATPDESPFPSNNPFFRPPDSTAVTLPVTLPPLPPRKPPSQATSPPPPLPVSHVPLQPPPRHPAPPPPPKPVRKPSHTHSTSTSNLIRQSLIAAKTTPKAPEGTLASAMKSLVIVKSSSSNQPSSSTSTSGGTLKDRVRGEREKEKSSDSSAATTTAFSQSGRSVVTSSSTPTSSASASSMEYVAGARVRPPPLKPLIRSTTTMSTTTPAATAPHSRSASPSKLSPTKLSMAEAQDIVQISASSSLSSTSLSSTDLASMNRPVRSKSLHGTASSGSMKGPVPTPPPRRRPESVQVTGSPFANAPTSAPSATTTSTNSPFNLSRRSSVQHPPPRPAHSPSPSRSTSTSVRSPISGTSTPPSHKEDPFSSIYSTVKHHLTPKSAESGVNTSIFQPAAAELQKIGSKLEGGLAPGRGYISHRGAEGERLVKKGYDDDDGGDADGYHRLSTYSDAPTVDSDTPGMDTNPPDPSPTTRFPPTTNNTESWMNWDPTPGPRPMPSRGGSDATITSNFKPKPASPTYSSSSARSSQQRRDVQLELDQLRARGMEGWGRMS